MDGDTQYLIRVGDAVQDVDELKDLPLMDMGIDGIDTIRLSDVAEVKVTDNSDETYAVINGNPGIMLSMEKQTGYSTGEVTNRILDKFKALEKEDSKLHLNVLMNQGVYIDMIVNSVMQNMIWGAILAILVLLLYLKDIKPTIVIACSIPLSVVAAIVLMYFTGITLNIISMSGLMLGIGMLVDNSIVVIEKLWYDLKHLSRLSPYAAINYIRRGIGYDDYLAEYAEYRNANKEDFYEVADEILASAKGYRTFEEWFAHIEEYRQELKKLAQEKRRNQNAVTFATLHSAKGLEFTKVYLIDVNEGVMPYKKAVLKQDVEEERRLFYVGMTRAKESLTICSVKKMRGKEVELSRFIKEAGKEP